MRSPGRNRMRALSAILVLALVLGALPVLAAGGEAVSIDITPEKETWYQSAVMVDGELMMVGEDLSAYRPGEEAIRTLMKIDREALEKDGISPQLRLFGDGERVFTMEPKEEGLHVARIGLSEDGVKALEKPLVLSWGEAAKRVKVDDYVHSPKRVVLKGEQLYMLYQVWGSDEVDGFILGYTLQDGAEPQVLEAKHVQKVTPYKDGQLLALLMDQQNSWDEVNKRQKPSQLGVISLEDGTITPLGETGVSFRGDEDLLYEPDTDTIYLTGNAELLRRVGEGDFEVSAYLGGDYSSNLLGGRLFLLENGKVLSANSPGVSIRTTDPSQLPAVRLNIQGGWMDAAARKAVREMGVAVRFVEDQFYPTAQEFGQALLGGETEIDIFMLDNNYMDLSVLMEKGYTLDLSGSQELTAYADGLYPELKAAGMLDEQLMMVPIYMNTHMFGYQPKVFTAMELQPPKTFFELCDLIEHWNDNLADEHTDFLPFSATSIRPTLTRLALTLFADAAQQRDEPFQFDDPLLKRMLQRVETLRVDNLGMDIDFEKEGAEKEAEALYNKVSMVSENFDLSLSNIKYMQDAIKYPEILSSERSGVRMPLKLTADEGIDMNVGLQTRMAAVSATTKHPEEAVRFLELYTKYLDGPQKAAMMPDMNEAIPNPNYERDIGYQVMHIDTLKAAVEKAEGAEKTELEAQLKKYTESVDAEKDRLRFWVTEEAVKVYRDMMQKRYVADYNSMRRVLDNENIQQSLQRYMQKQMPLEQFLQEADGKLRLMRLEAE